MSEPNDPATRTPRSAAHPVDPWRFSGSFLANMLSKAIPEKPAHGGIPFTPVSKPLSQCRVALLSTAGISMRDDDPFDMEYERQHPTKGDSSWRALRSDATSETIHANHLHIDTGYIERDLNVALPLDRLRALAEEGVIGDVAPTHYSIMGFQGNDSSQLEHESAPAIAEAMKSEEVDLALLAPV
jgi:D-proline reductase (dithiol) PrdB